MIELKNVDIGYDKVIISDINLKFQNKCYAILGESGKGKTTLLKSIANLIPVIKGNILKDEMPVLPAGKNGIYMVHQSYTNFLWLTCLENVLISRKVKKKLSYSDVLDAKEILYKVGLEKNENMYPSQLSGGMNQRLALARTLYAQPKTILMDEPLSALDGGTRKKMQDLILEYQRDFNPTILLVTHSKEEAEILSNEIVKL